VQPLENVIQQNAPELPAEDQLFLKEVVLWALTISEKLDRSESQSDFTFDAAGISPYFRN